MAKKPVAKKAAAKAQPIQLAQTDLAYQKKLEKMQNELNELMKDKKAK